MPDILIRGMEMPENCLFCPCSFWDQKTLALWCHALSTYDDNLVAENVTAIEAHCGKPTKAKRPEWCPLVELPPHGDLIDRKELCDGLVSNHPVVIYANTAPVIVPASEGVE